jgi:hypothetical protein
MEGDMTTETEKAIQARAYEIWQEQGSPEGRADEHWQQAERELGAGLSDLERNPGIGASSGATGEDPDAIGGESTFEGDVMNDTAAGGINPSKRGRTNK